MKKSYLLLLLIVISVSLVTGCGNDKKPPVTQKTEKAVPKKSITKTVKENVTKTVIKETVKKIEKKSVQVKKAVVKAVTPKPATKKEVTATAPAVSKKSIQLGGSIFKAKCIACHGVGGKGSAMAPAFVGNKWIKEADVADISSVIKHGRRGFVKRYKKFPIQMPAHASMPDNEVSALVSYIKSIN